MPEILDNMTVDCCQTCKAHGRSYVDFKYNANNGSSYFHNNDEMKKNMTDDTAFMFPVYGYGDQTAYGVYSYRPLIESPGVAFIINTDYNENPSNSLMTSVISTFPYLVVTVLTASIAGIIIWILVGGTFCYVHSARTTSMNFLQTCVVQ